MTSDKIKVWEKAHALTLQIYKATAKFPREELYGLTSQLRRAAASIPANIAEGYGRRGDAELARFLQMGMGSAYEVEYHLPGAGPRFDTCPGLSATSISHDRSEENAGKSIGCG